MHSELNYWSNYSVVDYAVTDKSSCCRPWSWCFHLSTIMKTFQRYHTFIFNALIHTHGRNGLGPRQSLTTWRFLMVFNSTAQFYVNNDAIFDRSINVCKVIFVRYKWLKKCVTVYNRRYSNTGTWTLNKMFATDIMHSACVKQCKRSSNMPHENSVWNENFCFLVNYFLIFMSLMIFGVIFKW